MNMFKKMLLVVTTICLVFAMLTACGNPTGTPNDQGGTGTIAPRPTPKVPTFSNTDLSITINGKTMRVGMAEKFVTEALGEPDSVDEVVSCLFGEDGYDRTLHYGECTFFSFPKKTGDGIVVNVIDEMYFAGENAPQINDGAVKIGSTKADVIKRYGEGYFMNGDMMMVYNALADEEMLQTLPYMYFMLENDVVTAIGYCANMYHPAE